MLTSFDIRNIANELGLSLLSIWRPRKLLAAKERLVQWQASGFQGEMAYMGRNPDLLTNPLALLPEAKSLIIIALPYESRMPGVLKPGFARVARYAWGEDYHYVAKAKLHQFIDMMQKQVVNLKFRIFSDAVPLVERSIANDSKLGFLGRNSMLITPKVGSYYFLSEILLDQEIDDSNNMELNNTSCGSCHNCIPACPTKAIVSDGVIDSSKCISYLTIEKRGFFNAWERKAIGQWVFGCDICQEVCPFNHRAKKGRALQPLEEFLSDKGVGEHLSLSDTLKVRDDAVFKERFKKTPLTRTGREGLLRNSACVSANLKDISLVPDLIDAAEEDSSPVVRAHCIYALKSLNQEVFKGENQRLVTTIRKAKRDSDYRVQNEVDLP